VTHNARSHRLDLAAKLAQRSVAPSVAAVASGARLPAPLVVELDPTSYCDLACPECISAPLLQKGRFARDRLLALGDELVDAGVRAVILIGGGEPLLHPAIGDLITKLSTGGIRVGITTNGTQIGRYLDVIAHHADWTRVSVDAATPEMYKLIRPHRGHRDVFNDIITQMRQLASRKRGDLGYSYLMLSRTHSSTTQVITNVSEIFAAATLAKDIGCDYFELKPEYDLHHFVLRQPQSVMDELHAQLDNLATLVDRSFAVLIPQSLRDVSSCSDAQQPKEYQKCPVAELRTLVTPTGAYICPYHRGNPAANYGDPTSVDFGTLWSGTARQQVLTQIVPADDCSFHCIRHVSNLQILQGTDIDLVDDYDLFI
jgi:wyosine [tRNA(Phe)-imidazoG37] synthetase (radical SAM superfamily)